MRKSTIERKILDILAVYRKWQKEKFPLQKEQGWLCKVNEEFKEFYAETKKRNKDINLIMEEAADYLFVLQGLKDYSPDLAKHLESIFFLAYSKLLFKEEFVTIMEMKFTYNQTRNFKFVPLPEGDGIYKGDHHG